jgi:hypothetical protein
VPASFALDPDRGRVKRVDRAGIAGIDPEPRAPFVIGARFEGSSPSDFLHDSSNGCRGSTSRSAATAFFLSGALAVVEPRQTLQPGDAPVTRVTWRAMRLTP